MRPRGLPAIAAIVLLVPVLRADERLVRTFSWSGGAPIAGFVLVDQDPDGFLWVSSPTGLFRFDGYEMQRVATGAHALRPGCAPRGEMIATDASNRLVRLRGGAIEPVATPFPQPMEGFRDLVCAEDGALWLFAWGDLWRGARDGSWAKVPLSLPADEETFRLSRGRGADVVVATSERARLLAPDGSLRPLADVPYVAQAVPRADGGWVLGAYVPLRGWTVVEVGDGGRRPVFDVPGILLGLVVRGASIWASYDYGLRVRHPDGSIETLPATPEAMTGGTLLLDREGSLWLATSRGLRQFPEPDTVGLHPEGSVLFTRWIQPSPRGLEVASWLGRYRPIPTVAGWSLVPATLQGGGAACTAPDGRTWTGGSHDFATIDRTGRARRHPAAGVVDSSPCAIAGDGTTWIPTNTGLFRLDAGAEHPVPALDGLTVSVLVTSRGEVLAGRRGELCTLRGASWTCDRLPPSEGFVSALHETDGGDVLVAGPGPSGVTRRLPDGRLEPVAIDPPATPWIQGLTTSPRGGYWLSAIGWVARVVEDGPRRLRVVERLGAAQGFPGSSASHVFEEPDGTLWVGTGVSLVRIPAAARDRGGPVGKLVITAARVDGADVDFTRAFELPYRRNRLELRASALSFRDPASIRYRHRLRPGDAWSEPVDDPRVRFFDLPPGRYELALQASLDGSTWIEAESPVRFRIDVPWYRSPAFFGTIATLVAAAAWIVARVRAGRRRVLEDQRRRIAMDLHDAIGSGLGTIGLLAGALRETGKPIATIASELGVSLGDIVWSLRESSGSLRAVAEHLLQRGHAMFAEAGPELRFDFPASWPSRDISLPLRRNLVLIALEAMHNAARHAGARTVTLRIAPERSGWILEVADDGQGLGGPTRPGGGMGLGNMRRRAADIGAAIEIESRSGGGTRVSVRFVL